MLFIGRSGDEVLFSAGELAVVVDEKRKLVSSIGSSEVLVASFTPFGDQTAPDSVPFELAVAATTDLDVKVFSNNDRLYTIPKAVQAEAKRALEWRKKEKRGGTPVGLNTARTLAKGGQIGIRKVRHIAKYFPRHQVDKKGKGYEPGEPNYPSNGRIAWALWGGDAAERWASAIVDRENKKAQSNSITASYNHIMGGYESPGRIEFDAFIESETLPIESAPQFYIRIRLDSGKVDRIYKVIPDGACFVWDDGMWEDLGNVNHDFETYDRSLDDPYDKTVKMHVPVDVQTSIILCGMFDSNPFEPVSISQLAPEEAQLFVDQVSGVDWGLIDAVLFDNTDNYVSFEDYSGSSITAAVPEKGDSVTLKSTITDQDGNYTPEERSSKARGQVRNKNGEFAKAGGRVVIGGNAKYSGTVQSANSDTQTLKIKLDNGNFVDVPGNTTEPADTFKPMPQVQSASSTKEITRNILGQPRTPIDSPVANVPNKLPQLRSNQVNTILADFSPWATDARTAKLTTGAAPTERSALIQQIMDSKTPNAYNDPSLRSFLEKSSKAPNGETLYPNAIWYRPDLRGVKPGDVEAAKPSSGLSPSPGKNPDSWLQQPAAGFAPTKPSSTTPSNPSSGGAPSSGAGTAPAKGKYVSVPSTGYSVGGTTIYPGESVDSINDKGEVGSVVQKFKDASGKETTEYKGADGSSWFGQKGTVVPKGFKLYEDGSIGPNDPKNPPKGSYDSSKTGPNGQVGKVLKTFTDSVTGQVRTKYSDGKSTWYGSKNRIVAPGFAMQEDGSWARTKPIQASALIAAAEAGKELTPDTSDVPPIYMAIVSPDDPQAVMDLVSLIPASTNSTSPMTFIRKPGKWEKNEQVLNDLNSPTPPPVVVLDDETLATVLEQVDSIEPMTSSGYDESDMKIVAAMIAAGGADRNKGNAEELRQYWLTGKGAAKIRWGTGGDWTRCVRQLSKYMGPRAKGYCALRHKEATGLWTGDKEHKQLFGKKGKARNAFSSDFVVSSEAMIASATIRARAEDARIRVFGEQPVSENQGASFFIPLVIPEGIESGDGRKFDAGAITIRDLPLPFLWQIKTGEGHSGSVVVGTITKMERVENGIGNAYGHFDTGEYGKEAERLVRGGFIRGVSADLDMFEAKEHENAAKDDADGKVGAGKMKITKARVMAVTLVPKPAYQECKVELVAEMGIEQEEEVIQDGVYVEGVNPLDASALIACGMVAGAIPVTPPKEWFNNPGLKKPTALTVTDDGKVFGHIAAWHVDHIGMAFGTRPPRSKSNYAFFHTGVVRTEEGVDMPVGQLTLAGGHAGLEASAQEAVRHYDDTASAVADVHAGEDAYGIWVSGALRPGTSPEQIRSLRASAPSGDWRPIKGALELVAVCQVNVPGFPIARARVASGQVMALVAAGASVLAQLKHDPLAELHNRIDKLEAPLVAAATDARTRMQAITAAIKAEELSNKVKAARNEDSAYMLQMLDDSDAELAVITRKERMKLAESKKALPDGSFPIRNANDLRNAIQAYGRSKPGKRGVVRRHIAKMARQLDKKELIPASWKEASDSESMVASLRERIAIVESIVASSENKSTFGTKIYQEEKGVFKSKSDSSDKEIIILNGGDTEEEETTFAAEISEKDLEGLTDEELDLLKKEVKSKQKAESKSGIYTPKTQPRDTKGKFRQVLARLKVNLGDSGSDEALKKIKEAENLDNAGDYAGAANAAGDLLGVIDRLDTGALNAESLENVRLSAGQLGSVIANLPFAFGQDAQKIRFSDIPPALQDLMDKMITRVEAKIGKKDANIATKDLKGFMSGADYYSQSEISSQMSKLLRLLT